MSSNLVADPPPPPAPPSDPRPRRGSGPPPGAKPPGRWKSVLAYVLGVVLIVVGIVFAMIAYVMVTEHKSMNESFGDIAARMINVPPPAQVFGKDRIYVMLLGIDYNYDEKGMPYSKDARSDTIMIAGIDFPTKSMKLISVLRDTAAIVNGREVKINEAYRAGGVKTADQVIGDFLGMPVNERGTHFDRYVTVKINGIKELVNAIGGINVPVTETMDYDDTWGHLSIHFKPGMYHMNGEQAQGYMRFRHDACSDPCRTKRQQQIIHIVMQKLKGDKFNDLLHLRQLLDVVDRNVVTNMTDDEKKSIAWSFKDANTADLSKAETIGYVGIKDSPYAGELLIPDEAQKAKLVAELLGPYGNVTPPPQTALSSVKPSTVHVDVRNGSGIAGLATAVSEKLRKAGYVIDAVGNADSFGYDTTQIRPASKVPYVGERVRVDLGVPGAIIAPATDATPGPHTAVTVIVGSDYAAAQATAAPTSSAAPAALKH
jgi:polyisoprenyl-teichoic acid--peptidoglycan teichoic acid transferase